MSNFLYLKGKIKEDSDFMIWQCQWEVFYPKILFGTETIFVLTCDNPTLKHFRHLSFLMTIANAKFCPFKDKMLHSKSHGICIYSQGWETHPKPALWFYESGCEEGFHSLTLCQCHYFSERPAKMQRIAKPVSSLFKWLILDELSCHLFTGRDRLSLIKMYWSLNLFPAIKKALINEIAMRAINNT